MIELPQLARGCTMLVLAEAARGRDPGRSAVRLDQGQGVEKRLTDPDLAAALARLMRVELTALRAIDLDRKVAPGSEPQ